MIEGPFGAIQFEAVTETPRLLRQHASQFLGRFDVGCDPPARHRKKELALSPKLLPEYFPSLLPCSHAIRFFFSATQLDGHIQGHSGCVRRVYRRVCCWWVGRDRTADRLWRDGPWFPSSVSTSPRVTGELRGGRNPSPVDGLQEVGLRN